jgi:hypothetical protein
VISADTNPGVIDAQITRSLQVDGSVAIPLPTLQRANEVITLITVAAHAGESASEQE